MTIIKILAGREKSMKDTTETLPGEIREYLNKSKSKILLMS